MVKEESQPSDTKGETAATTKTDYYSHAKDSEHTYCGEHDAWAGLPCITYPAEQPSPSEGNPTLPLTIFSKYSSLDQLEESQQWVGFEARRTTTIGYDEAGRQVRVHVTGNGAELPAVETEYDEETGAPVSQHFVCSEECEGFDSQKVTTVYDKLGRPIEYEDADGNKSGVAYDLLGRPAIASDGKGYQELSYDEESGVLTEMTDSAAGAFKAAYNAEGQMTEQLLPDGLGDRRSPTTAKANRPRCNTSRKAIASAPAPGSPSAAKTRSPVRSCAKKAASATTNTATTRPAASPSPRNSTSAAPARPAPTPSKAQPARTQIAPR